MKTIYLCRHGETTGDVEDRYGGDYDDLLTERGRAQARALAQELADTGVDQIFASPRHRAREVGELVAAKLDRPLVILDDLRERNAYGPLTGLVKAEARIQFRELDTALADPTATIEGAEPYRDFVRRVEQAMATVRAAPVSTGAVITHGGVIRAFVRSVMSLGELTELGDCAILELSVDSDSYTLDHTINAKLETYL